MNGGGQGVFVKVRVTVTAILVAFLMLLALQNMAQVELTILFWTFETRRIVVIGVSFLLGFAIAWIVKATKRLDLDQ